jgi:hypothetical protein
VYEIERLLVRRIAVKMEERQGLRGRHEPSISTSARV